MRYLLGIIFGILLCEFSHASLLDGLDRMERLERVKFKNRIGWLESRNNYQAVNRFGCLGRYQFCKPALIQLGMYNYRGEWVGWLPYRIKTKNDFLDSGEAQEYAFDVWLRYLDSFAKAKGLYRYNYNKAQILAGCHLVGCGGLRKALKYNKVVKDGNGMSVRKWMSYFKNIRY